MQKGLHNPSYKSSSDLPKCQVLRIPCQKQGLRWAGAGIVSQFPGSVVSNPDDILLIVFLLGGAFLGLFYLVDLWAGSPFRATVRDAWADVRARRAERQVERRARRDVDQNPRVVIRIRDVWEAKR
jgi:hypothetical protein